VSQNVYSYNVSLKNKRMLKNISNLGKAIPKDQLISINGGGRRPRECEFSGDPSTDWCCALPQGCP
jgi:hypothetical protein